MRYLFLLAFLATSACRSVPKAELVQAVDFFKTTGYNGSYYTVDTANTIIEWVGTKQTGSNDGLFRVDTGYIIVSEGIIRSGKFLIDINSLKSEIKKSNQTLEQHLLSDDFFDAVRFPYASFEIISVQQKDDDRHYIVQGNLTLKDVIKGISFPATISITESKIAANGNFNIDRSQWGMSYGNDKSLGNWFIRPIVNISIKMMAVKQ